MLLPQEITLNRSDIDFSPSTVKRIKQSILKHIEEMSLALCETPQSLKHALLQDTVKLGSYQHSYGTQMIYIHLNQHDYVIPCSAQH